MPDVLAQELARALEDEIISGRLAPETRLVEEEVAQAYGISRSPVREALRRLEQDGLVLREARRGIWVAPIARADLDEVYSCRVALEGLAAEQAAEARTAPNIDRLEAAFADMERAHERGDVPGYFLGNLAFTDAIHAAADNATLKRLLNRISKQAQRYRFLAYSAAPELMTQSLAGSRDILSAIVGGEPARAREITERLIRRSWDVVGPIVDRMLADAARSIPANEE
ncbi:MAG: GntR family transcriptional regulator [Dongiaceae bacterium]